jgi:hypothetical protein
MPVIQALFLLLVGTLVLAGQGLNPTAQKSSVKPSDLCTLDGVVVKSTTGEGIKGASVQLSPAAADEQSYSASTDKSGYFIMHDVKPGRYVINAAGAGYTQQVPGTGQGNTRILELTPGKTVKGLSFRLVPPGVISGTVYDEDGDPVTQAQVRALRAAGSGAHRQLTESGSAQTNDLGEYRIWGLEPGQYLVVATYQRQQPGFGEDADELVLPTFHPSTQDVSQAMLVDVQPGAEVSEINVDLGRAHAVAVRGRVVVDGAVKSLRRVSLSLTPHTSSQTSYSLANYSASVQNDLGDFEIPRVPPGSYFLTASMSDEKRQLFARVPVEVGNGNVDGVTVVLSSALELAGRIRVEGSSPFDVTQLDPWLQPIDNMMGGGSGKVRPDGTFVIQNVFDGTYQVRLFGLPEGYYVKSARLGGSDVLESGLAISHSQPPSRLEITISPDGGRVEGSVTKDQNPVRGAWVVLAPDPPHRDRVELYSIRMTDSFGRFTMMDLPPGGYKLFAWEPVQGTNYGDPDFFKAFEDRATPVEIHEQQQQSVRLEVITAQEQIR